MKAKFFALLAVVLAVVSCQKDVDVDVNVGGEVDTVVTVSLPETTRATNSAEGAFVNVVESDDYTIRYIFQVFYNGTESQAARQVIYSDNKVVCFPVRLVPDRHYNFVVWADIVMQNDKTLNQLDVYDANADLHYNTEDLKSIKLKGEWYAMDETRDAFTGHFDTAVDGDKTPYNGAKSINITLTRPFAKLRIITTDMEQLNDLVIAPTTATVEYTVDHYNAFNAFAGQVIGDSKNRDIKHENFEIKDYDDNVDDKSKVLFTDYFFAADNDEVINFTFDVYDQNNELIKSNAFNTAIPVKRNNLTTIAGNILTEGNNVTVTVDPVFGGKQEWPSEEAEKLAAAAMFGGEVTLTEDVVLNQPLDVKSNMTLNLGGKKLEGVINVNEAAKLTVNNGTIVNVDKSKSGITSNGDLTLNDVTIESARHAVRIESGNVVINGGTYKVVPISASTLYALNVGDDNTVANVTIKGGTFIGPKGTMADSGGALTVRSSSTVTIEGGDFSGGKTKTLSANQGATLTVKGGTFDQNPSNYVAAGYKAIAADGVYYVLPETIANAAEAEGVTAVTESTADVATALATDNDEATLFMWNDVAYIAKYGEVVITSAADEATTVRGVVEYSTGLTSATVADGIEVVGNRTFRQCANLETVALPNTLTEIGPAVFQSCSKLANITIPESVTTIGEGAFAECTALTSINIPAGITRLEKDVLRNTGLVSVEIPASVNYIGTYAFRDCESLTEIKILSPEFTIEINTFTNMTAPVPTMTIHVVNDEMKAYLESILSNYDKTYITVKGPKPVSNASELETAVTEKYAIVNVAAGEYTFPSSVAAGVTIQCEEGTVFTGTSGLNINGATVIGAEFKNEGGVAVRGTINGTFKNCTFTGEEALRWCYATAGDTIIFEDCVIKTYYRGFHFDGMAGNVIFRNCEINGFNAYGGEGTATFEGCTIGCDQSRYAGLNIYSNTNLVNCTFNYVSGKTNFIDMEGTGKTLKITNCKVYLDGVEADIKNYVGGSKLAENTVIYE